MKSGTIELEYWGTGVLEYWSTRVPLEYLVPVLPILKRIAYACVVSMTRSPVEI
jgi:hypothetical protein